MNSVILYIAKRYAFSKSKTKAINIITAISAIGIIVSTMTLFIVLSVFNGLEDLSKSFSNQLDPDLVILPKQGKHITILDNELNNLQQIEGVKSIDEVIEERVIFTFANKQQIANIKGVSSNYHNNFNILEFTHNGTWFPQNSSEVVMGRGLYFELGYSNTIEEHTLEAIAMKPGEGLSNTPEDAYVRLSLYPIDIYDFNSIEVNNKYIFSDLSTAKELLSLKQDQYSKLEININNTNQLQSVINKINEKHPNKFQFKTRAELNESLYKMLKIEKIAVYLVFTLVIIITLFCLCGTIIMIIIEKKENLKTLISLGFSEKQLKNIFFLQGMIITLLGTLIGLILGIAITFTQIHFELIKIAPNFAYPIKFDAMNLLIVFLTLTILGIIASLIASSQTSKQIIKK